MRAAVGTGNVDIFEHAVLRAAAWPIEITDLFAAPELVALAERAIAARAAVVARRPSSVAALERAVPTLPERDQRAIALRLKRRIHGSVKPLGSIPQETNAAIMREAPELYGVLEAERCAREQLAVLEDEFDRAYAAESARQRAVLLDVTSDARFLRALSIANPGLAERWERRIGRGQSGPPGKARERRLEATVLRYLLRAAGRATPDGAWAGVVPVEIASPSTISDGDPTESFSVAPIQPRYAAAPDLDPFARIIAVLSRCRRYWEDYPVRLDPTVHQVGTTWWHERAARGDREWTALDDDPLLAVIIEAYRDGEPRRASPLLDALAALVPERDTLRGLLGGALEHLVSLGVLRSELAMPTAPSTPWEALDSVVARMVEPDRSLWLDVVATIRRHCEWLAASFDVLEPEEVQATHTAVRAAIARLANAADHHDPLAERVLRLDMRLPFEVTWSADALARVRAAVVEVLGFHMAAGAAERFRSESMHPILSSVAPDSEVSLASLLRAFAPGSRSSRPPPSRVTVWDNVLIEHRWEPVCTLPADAVHPRPRPGPGGVLLFTLAVRRSVPGVVDLRVEWGRPQPALFFARWHRLLGGDADGKPPLQIALECMMAEWERDGVRAVEIVGDDVVSLGAAVRPRLAPIRLHPHGRSDVRPGDLSVVLDHDRAWFRSAIRDGRYVPVYDSAATIGLEDPCSRLLLQLAMGHGWELLSIGPAVLTGGIKWPHVPRVELPGGTVLSGEQWFLDQEAVAALTATSGWVQYLAWREHVGQLALPELVWVGVADGFDPERLLLRCDSPPAVRCLFDELASEPRALLFVEAHGDPSDWPVRDNRGGHHVAELAVSWFDDAHWSALCTREEAAR